MRTGACHRFEGYEQTQMRGFCTSRIVTFGERRNDESAIEMTMDEYFCVSFSVFFLTNSLSIFTICKNVYAASLIRNFFFFANHVTKIPALYKSSHFGWTLMKRKKAGLGFPITTVLDFSVLFRTVYTFSYNDSKSK